MLKAMGFLGGLFLPLIFAQEVLQPVNEPPRSAATRPAATQPASQPSEPAYRSPQLSSDLLNQLLNVERARPIPPQLPAARQGQRRTRGLLMEGTVLIDRPGRYVARGDRAEFEFMPDSSGKPLQSMEILRTQQLELMEREVAIGSMEFVISGEVKRYRDRNTLELIKVVRRVSHGNIGP